MTKAFDNKCNIFSYEKVLLPNKSTFLQETLILQDIPCKLSFRYDKKVVTSKEVGNFLNQDVLVFLPINLEEDIKAGSKFVVTYLGEELTFTNSSVPIKYVTHQEVRLTSAKDIA